MPCTDNSTICARRQVTTDPELRRNQAQQPIAFVVADVEDPDPLGHHHLLGKTGRNGGSLDTDNGGQLWAL